MGDHTTDVTGADVIGAVAAFPAAGVDPARVALLVDAGECFPDVPALMRRMPPHVLGIATGTWQTVFAPLFGEFE